MRKPLIHLLIILQVILLLACEYEKRPEPNIPSVEEIISFAEDIIPRFNSSCAISGCHDGVSSATTPNFTEEVAYQEIWERELIDTARPEKSLLYLEITDLTSMGQYATEEDVMYILRWIEEGGANN